MAKFKISWSDDSVEIVEQSDCETVEQFINCRFGSAGVGKAKVTLADGLIVENLRPECNTETKAPAKVKK